jgi:hypothetical protein
MLIALILFACFVIVELWGLGKAAMELYPFAELKE